MESKYYDGGLAKFTFDRHSIVVDKELVYCLTTNLSKDTYDSLIEHYKVDSLNVETVSLMLDQLSSGQVIGDGDYDHLHNFINEMIHKRDSRRGDNIEKINKFIRLTVLDDKGFYYFQYISVDDIIKTAIKNIEKEIKTLEKYGKVVEFKYT